MDISEKVCVSFGSIHESKSQVSDSQKKTPEMPPLWAKATFI
jgi:hypothetical protein